MFYFYIFIILYGLSLTEAYKIKVSAQVEVGRQATKLFRDTLVKLATGGQSKATDGMRPEDVIKMFNEQKEHRDLVQYQYLNQLTTEETHHEPRPPEHFDEEDIVENREDTVMEKMLQNEQRDVHLYGSHYAKHGRNDRPLNNVNL